MLYIETPLIKEPISPPPPPLSTIHLFYYSIIILFYLFPSISSVLQALGYQKKSA